MNPITRVCQIKEQAEKTFIAFMKFELGGTARGVSGKGNRVMVAKTQANWLVEWHEL